MKANYILIVAAAFLISACTKTNEQPGPEGILMTFRAYQEGAQETKTTVQDGGTQVYWEPNDEIKVFFKSSCGRFVSQNSELAGVADFSGTLNIIVGANEGFGASNQTWGLYPYRAEATNDGEYITTTLPASQTGRAGSFAKNTHICLALSSDYNLAFYNVTGGLRFSLTQEGIKSVTFKGNNGESLAGKIKLTFEGGVPAVKEVSEGETTLTLIAPGGGTFQTGKWYYIEALPGTLSNGFKMVFSKGNETAKISSSGSVTISRGKYGSLADADYGLIFKANGGDDPDPSSVIQFADPIAKYACVEKFDTNGDGEVSYAEAAAATSLSGLFSDWNTVVHFDEIRFFSGVSSTVGVFTGLKKLESITIPDNITTLGSFQNCEALNSVTLPTGLKSLPSNCFDGCTSLASVLLPTTITSIPYCCFRNCSSLSGINLPDTITSFGDCSFQRCSLLSGVSLPSGLTEIPKACFDFCENLSIVKWPSNLKYIRVCAFRGCRFLDSNSSLELPKSVTSIGYLAFMGLHHVVIPSTSFVTIEAEAFADSYTYLYVPSIMLDIYKSRENWKDYADFIRPIDDYPVSLMVGGTIAEAIDLGLSVKWATWNIGASTPEEYGDFFAWGETQPKWDYDWSTYKWCNGYDNKLTKYCTLSSYWDSSNPMDNKMVLDPEDDAAHVNWGGSWRMPTYEEWQELTSANNCSWRWTTQNGIKGYIITSKKDGYQDKSIFLPAGAGYINGYTLKSRNSVSYYWSSIINYAVPDSAYKFFVQESQYDFSYQSSRCYGLSVRPVCPKD